MNKRTFIAFLVGGGLLAFAAVFARSYIDKKMGERFMISTLALKDKIKGGWAGQTIGCTYGGPTEFRYNGVMIDDTVNIPWREGYVKHWFDTFPGLYDDVYMDLTFVEVFDRLGLDAPIDSFANAYANAGYTLWHANQSGRYNILNGIMPPQSGHWLNNPHADDIDYQIEADYAGLMSPGMPNSASEISDKIGHIMNYGNGWYGGVYVGAMYSLAFVSDDVEHVVTEALKTIPEESQYYRCMADVIEWHKQYPEDWKKTWKLCQDKWNDEIGCPDGVFQPLNIDAVINSAYVIIGLLYGNGDFDKTMDISTRCGQDSDCNPATAAGILGTMLGYENIPKKWTDNLVEVQDIPFSYTDISLNRVYRMSYEQALQMIIKNGGKIKDEEIIIKCQTPKPVRFEESFSGMKPDRLMKFGKKITELEPLTLDCSGVVFKGYVKAPEESQDYVAEVAMYVDGELVETAKLPAAYEKRRNDLFWKYQLPDSAHVFRFEWLNPCEGVDINFGDILLYKNI